MTQSTDTPEIFLKRTRLAFMWTRILNTPFWALYSMLPIFLYKDLHATPFQITALITLKPLVSILSMYWSVSINKRRDRLLSNIIWAGILSHLPFFLFPFIDAPWFFIISFGFYMMLSRGVMPAWMEILKLNIPEVSRERVFAHGSTFGYLGSGILPIALGWLLDGYFQAWRWIFPVAAFVSLLAVFFQLRIPIRPDNSMAFSAPAPSPSFFNQLTQPWVKAWELVHTRPDFGRFQVGFMLGGCGLMVMQPALPSFFVDVLNLSYTELAIALALCKGIGFALTSSLWAMWINRVDIYRFSSVVTILAVLFPLCLLWAQFDLIWLYIAYFSYGIMQAGSELSWNMSGPIFAGREDSSIFSSVNVLTVGLRGCVAPILGSLLGLISNSSVVMLLGGFFCLLATLLMSHYSKNAKRESIPIPIPVQK